MEIYWQISFLVSFPKAKAGFMDAKGGPSSLPHPELVLSMIAFDGNPWTSVNSPQGVCTQYMGDIHVVLGINQHIMSYNPPLPSAEVTC